MCFVTSAYHIPYITRLVVREHSKKFEMLYSTEGYVTCEISYSTEEYMTCEIAYGTEGYMTCEISYTCKITRTFEISCCRK